MCVAKPVPGGSFHVDRPEPVGDLTTFWGRIHRRAGSRHVLVGFDFPIGLPTEYARAARISEFMTAIESFGRDAWEDFYDLAVTKEEIALHRPFYPYRPGGTSHAHLLDGLGLSDISQLLRRCEMPTPNLGAASPLFWTLGGKQVGRAAIIGWRDVIVPALQQPDFDLKIWPFDGDLWDLLESRASIVVETYPAAACVHLGFDAPGNAWSKRSQDGRRRQAEHLFEWAGERRIDFSAPLKVELEDGFGSGSDGEDPFDAAVGLFSMLEVLLSDRAVWAPEDSDVRSIEGWILGRDITSL